MTKEVVKLLGSELNKHKCLQKLKVKVIIRCIRRVLCSIGILSSSIRLISIPRQQCPWETTIGSSNTKSTCTKISNSSTSILLSTNHILIINRPRLVILNSNIVRRISHRLKCNSLITIIGKWSITYNEPLISSVSTTNNSIHCLSV